MKAIVAEHLSKSYGKFLAVDDVSFEVEEGEVFGFLGPNGAGKTTTIKMLNTLLPVSKGKAWVSGFELPKDGGEARKRIGLVPQDMTLDREMTGRRNLVIQAKLYRLDNDLARKKIQELLEFSGLRDVADKEVMEYSWGMQKRLAIIMGFIHSPKVLFLDEPTLGLDTQSRMNIWNYIRRLNKEFNATIFLTTHYLNEADELCDRIGIIDRGKLKAMGTPKELKGSLGGEMVLIGISSSRPMAEVEKAVASMPSILGVTSRGEELSVEVSDGASSVPKVVLKLTEMGVEVRTVEVVKRSLDQVFVKYVDQSSRQTDDEDALRFMAREKLMGEGM